MNSNRLSFGIGLATIMALATSSCKETKKEPAAPQPETSEKVLAFEQRKVVDSAKFWWAHTQADVTGDGIADLLYINNNASGGHLAYYKGQKGQGLWKRTIIADAPETEGLFASGDLEASDIDGDGDMDVFAVGHPGEWTDAGATAKLFWYENMGDTWKAHAIGTAPDAVKDVSFSDFDKDGRMDMAILTFDEHTLSIFKQNGPDAWERVQYITADFLHEGMGIGDFNNDGFPDIVATGMLYYNPKGQLGETWQTENLNVMWNNQEGDWSRNGTKTFVHDENNDGYAEIYMAHSERAGYPLVRYQRSNGEWSAETITDSIAACHTLQVYDFDNDGDYDILAGINYGRAINLDQDNFDVSLFINKGAGKGYDSMVIEENGIYNGQAIDYDKDGDMDVFRYPNHEATDFFLMENTLN